MDAATVQSCCAIRRLERCGMVSWPAWFSPEESMVERHLGLRLHNVRGALVAVAPGADMPIFNRVLGIGHIMPATPDLLDLILRLYRKARVPGFYVQVSPTAEPAEIGDWLRDRGFRPAVPWARLSRGVEPVEGAHADVHLVEIGASRLPYVLFGRVVQRSFGYPSATARWFGMFIGRRGWRHYLAIDPTTGKPVGAAAFFRSSRSASLEIAAVLPRARHRGIHSALVARQIRDAAAEGCDLVTMETAVDVPDSRGQAFRNARRLGFELAYFTANWEWRTRWPVLRFIPRWLRYDWFGPGRRELRG
jgi:GNAT superfamily N-acetyltransferase